MAEAGTYYVSVVPDMSKFNQQLDKGAGRAKGIFGKIGSIGIGTALGNALSKGFDSFLGTLDSGIKRFDTLSNFPKIMENVGISTDASQRAIDKLSKGIDGLPTTLDSAASATQRFTLQNGDVEKSADMFLALNDAILAGGQSADLQASALEQVSQAYSKGKPDMAEWRTMQMSMGPALQMVAESWGMSVDDMGEALRNGDRSMDDFMGTLQQLDTQGVGNFKSLQDQASVSTDSIGTAMENVKSRMSKAWATILESIGQERIAGAINDVSSSFGTLAEFVAPMVGNLADALGQFVSNIDLSPLQGTFDSIGPTIQTVADNVSNFISTVDLSPMIEGFSGLLDAMQPLFDVFTQFITGQGPEFQGMMDRINQHLADMGPAWDQLCEAVGTFAEIAAPIVSAIIGNMISAFVGLMPIVTTIATCIVDFATGAVAQIQLIVDAVPKIIDAFSKVPDKVGGFFSNVVSKISSIPGRIVGFFTGIGGKISNAIGSIHFPKPHVTWESLTIAGAKTPVKLPHVDWYAKGGIIDGAQLIGAGERGAELVWPSYDPYLSKYADAITARMGYVDDGSQAIILWLATNLGPIISEYAPRANKRDLARMIGGVA